jgi:hypothetical protein
MSDTELLTTETYAISSVPLEVHVDDTAGFVPESLLGRAKLTATAPAGTELFLGVAPTADVERYLSDVAHASLTDLAGGPTYETSTGGAPPMVPADADIWRASTTGSGEVTVSWPVEGGSWTVVAMNADGSMGVEADVAAGATLPILDWVPPLLLSVGGTGIVLAVVVLVITIRAAGRATPSPQGDGR